jgi:hypothetical protein
MIPSTAGYRYDQDAAGLEAMDYLAFIARVTSHIPDKGHEGERFCVFQAIFRSVVSMIGPDGILHVRSRIVDSDQQPGIFFSYEGRIRHEHETCSYQS